MKTIILLVVLVLGAVGLGFYLLKGSPGMSSPDYTKTFVSKSQNGKFSKEAKSLHFVNSSPTHGEVFAASPVNVVLNFNFDLGKSSAITFNKDGKDYGVGETVVDENKLAMRRVLPEKLEDGIYTVSYKACWPDESCHSGEFQFEIDSETKSSYVDMTGKKEVEIDMENIAFLPAKVLVSKGTKITWVNKESAGHYVNTDPHAGHNHFIYLNSKYLNLNDSYSHVFTKAGEYPYHCSAHAGNMVGRVLVE